MGKSASPSLFFFRNPCGGVGRRRCLLRFLPRRLPGPLFRRPGLCVEFLHDRVRIPVPFQPVFQGVRRLRHGVVHSRLVLALEPLQDVLDDSPLFMGRVPDAQAEAREGVRPQVIQD